MRQQREGILFETGMDFMTAYVDGARYDLLLLDIMMDELSGMELARSLRKQGSDAAIIFITSNPDYAIEGYDVRALHYLMKPLDSETLSRVISADYKRRFSQSYLFVKSGTQNLRLPLKEIIFLETLGRHVQITALLLSPSKNIKTDSAEKNHSPHTGDRTASAVPSHQF